MPEAEGPEGDEDAVRASSFAGHYGEALLADGVASIPRALHFYQGRLGLSLQQVWFVLYVLAHKSDDGLPHPRLQELARQSGLGLRQIKNIKSSLVEAGMLEVMSRFTPEGGQDANSYDFAPLFAQLESFILSDPALPALAPTDQLREAATSAGDIGRTCDQDPSLDAEAVEEKAQPGSTTSAAETGPHNRHKKDYSLVACYSRVVMRCGLVSLPRAIFFFPGRSCDSLPAGVVHIVHHVFSVEHGTAVPEPAQNSSNDEPQ